MACFQQAGEVDTDADTGRHTLTLKGDVGTEKRVPAGSTFDAALDDWIVRAVNDDEFELVLAIDPALELTTGNIGDEDNSATRFGTWRPCAP